MYQTPGFGGGYAGAASRRYAAVHAGSRVESATPHQLVKLLYEELILSIDTAIQAQEQGDMPKATSKHGRALSILHALDASLDFDKGGEVAISLVQVYRETRRLLLASAQNKTNEEAQQARSILAEIAEAWNQIG